MDKERVKSYVDLARQNREKPIRVARFDEGDAVLSRLLFEMPEARLIIVPGVIYIVPSMAAVNEILMRLDKELEYYSKREKVREKEREIRETIEGIKDMIESGDRKYVSRNAIITK